MSLDQPGVSLLSSLPRRENRQLAIKHYLKDQVGAIFCATVAALVLALVAAMVGILIGPAMQVLTSPASTVFTFDELLGPTIGSFLGRLNLGSSIGSGELLRLLPILLVVAATIKACCGALSWFLWERVGEQLAFACRRDLIDGYLDLSPTVRLTTEAQRQEANLVSTVSQDVRMLREYVVRFYGGLPRELLQSLFLGVTLFLLSPRLIAFFFLALLPAILVLGVIGRKVRRRTCRALEDFAELSEWLQQRLLGIETIKHYQKESVEIASMDRLTAELGKRFLHSAHVKARTSPSLEIIASCAIAGILLLALREVAAGRTSGSVMLSFFATLGLLSQSVGTLGKYFNINREGRTAYERVEDRWRFLRRNHQGEELPLVPTLAETSLLNQSSNIEIRNLQVRYPNSPKPSLFINQLTIPSGAITGICGPSGAGKSTFMKTLLGLHKPEAGEVRFNKLALQPGFTFYVPQSIRLASATVGENVAWPMLGPIDSRLLWQALTRVDMAEFVRGLPAREATLIGSEGVTLSGGQAQRILLARLMYHAKAKLILVDEGTSGLDSQNEALFYGLLRERAEAGALVLTIAHRPTALSLCDNLILFEGGNVAEDGPRAKVEASKAWQRLIGSSAKEL